MTRGQSETDVHSRSVANSLIGHLGAASQQRVFVPKPQCISIIHFDWEQAALQDVNCRSCISEGLFETGSFPMQHSRLRCPFIYWSLILDNHTSQWQPQRRRFYIFEIIFLNWSYLWEWTKNGAMALQMYWWTGLVFLFPAHFDSRAHIIIYSQSFGDGAKSRWYLNTVLKMQNKYLNSKYSGKFAAGTAAIIQMDLQFQLGAYFVNH